MDYYQVIFIDNEDKKQCIETCGKDYTDAYKNFENDYDYKLIESFEELDPSLWDRQPEDNYYYNVQQRGY